MKGKDSIRFRLPVSCGADGSLFEFRKGASFLHFILSYYIGRALQHLYSVPTVSLESHRQSHSDKRGDAYAVPLKTSRFNRPNTMGFSLFFADLSCIPLLWHLCKVMCSLKPRRVSSSLNNAQREKEREREREREIKNRQREKTIPFLTK